MARITPSRVRIGEDGSIEVVDPGFDTLPLLMELDPNFRVKSASLPGFVSPRILRTRETLCGLTAEQLAAEPVDDLWQRHNEMVGNLDQVGVAVPLESGSASLLDLKIELAWRLLAACELCAHRCGIDRTRGERGVCCLDTRAIIADHFVHIAEESPINPSLVVNLAGCGLRCRYCQQWKLLDPSAVSGTALDADLWPELDLASARSISFVGGNPDESLHAILCFLAAAPRDLTLPIVWNSHAYTTEEVLRLLDGIVDTYVPDFKYGAEACGRALSRVRDYPVVAAAAIQGMLEQGVPVLVRLLLLPGHLDCCHRPALEALAGLGESGLMVSIRGQYCPDWQISSTDGAMSRRTTEAETDIVCQLAQDLRLMMVD